MISLYLIYIRDTLKFTICVFAVCMPASHEIYMKFSKSVKNITLSNLVQEIINVFVKVLKMKIFFNTRISILFQKYLMQMLQHHQHL